jgi:hypothetical protein
MVWLKTAVLATAAILSAHCASYRMEIPNGFDSESVHISGPRDGLKLGEWRVQNFRRNSSLMSGFVMSTATPPRQTSYQFLLTDGTTTFDVNCLFSVSPTFASGTRVPSTNSGESLLCNINGPEKWVLDLTDNPVSHLSGWLQGPMDYDVQGAGAPGSRITGFYVSDSLEKIASIQTAGKMDVRFAAALNAQARSTLMPVVAALLVLDERD